MGEGVGSTTGSSSGCGGVRSMRTSTSTITGMDYRPNGDCGVGLEYTTRSGRTKDWRTRRPRSGIKLLRIMADSLRPGKRCACQSRASESWKRPMTLAWKHCPRESFEEGLGNGSGAVVRLGTPRKRKGRATGPWLGCSLFPKGVQAEREKDK